MKQEDWDELQKAVEDLQGRNLRPALIRTIVLGGLFVAGIALIWIAFSMKGNDEFFAGLLVNIGCELIGSIIIFIAVDQLAQSLKEQSNKEATLANKIQEMRLKSQEEENNSNYLPLTSDISKIE